MKLSNKIYSISIIFIAIILVSSCSKKPDIEYTAPYKFAGEWFVTLMVNGRDVGGGHTKLLTYNTSANTNEIWVDDAKHGYGFKVKATTDQSSMSFTATNSTNEYFIPTSTSFPKTVILNNGKVLVGAGKTKSGNPVDSIYMEAVFSDDPGNKYVISGHYRTGFFEDEY